MSGVSDWIKTFARPMRGHPLKFVVDEIDHEFYIVLDCEAGEEPASVGTCDVLVCRLMADDALAEAVRIRSNADQAAVTKLFAGMDIARLSHSHQPAIPRMP